MKTYIYLLLAGLFLCVSDVNGQKRKKKKANQETVEWKYDIETEALGMQNNKVIRVWSYSKDINVARLQATKNAIHGIIFKGAPGNTNKRVAPVLALVTSFETREKFKSFFDSFFADGGDYRMYAVTTDISDSVVKIDKRMYKVGVVVNIQYDALRKMLEERGIVKKLSYGF